MGLFGSKVSRAAVMSEATSQMVEEIISSEKVVIFSKTYCPYCKMAKEAFEKLKKKYKVVELDERDDAEDIQNVLGDMTGARTVPRVFVNGDFIGGGTDVKALYESGKLATMVGE